MTRPSLRIGARRGCARHDPCVGAIDPRPGSWRPSPPAARQLSVAPLPVLRPLRAIRRDGRCERTGAATVTGARRAHRTAGRPALLGSVAAARAPSGRAGPPRTSSIACSWPKAASKAPVTWTSWPWSPRASMTTGAIRDSTATNVGGAKWPSGSTSQRGARHGARDVDAAVDHRRHELGVDLRLGVAAHRADHDPRAGARRRGTASPAAVCGASASPAPARSGGPDRG